MEQQAWTGFEQEVKEASTLGFRVACVFVSSCDSVLRIASLSLVENFINVTQQSTRNASTVEPSQPT